MDPHGDISEFLTSRRAKLTPADIGLPDFGGRRRVQGSDGKRSRSSRG